MLRDADREPVHFVCQIQDVTERNELEQIFRFFATTPLMTELAPAAAFDDRATAPRRLTRPGTGTAVALLIVDLVDFSRSLDALGRAAGDERRQGGRGSGFAPGSEAPNCSAVSVARTGLIVIPRPTARGPPTWSQILSRSSFDRAGADHRRTGRPARPRQQRRRDGSTPETQCARDALLIQAVAGDVRGQGAGRGRASSAGAFAGRRAALDLAPRARRPSRQASTRRSLPGHVDAALRRPEPAARSCWSKASSIWRLESRRRIVEVERGDGRSPCRWSRAPA